MVEFKTTLQDGWAVDSYIEVPDRLIKENDWTAGDEIEWTVFDSGMIVINNRSETLRRIAKRKHEMKPIDSAIANCAPEYEETIELHKTYGGD